MPERRSFGALFDQVCRWGYARMSPEARVCLMRAVSAAQGADGLFCGRGGQEDLYYTFFGLQLALIADVEIQLAACRARLAATDVTTLDVVHGCAWLRADSLLRLLAVPRRGRELARRLRGIHAATTRHAVNALLTRPAAAFPHQDADSPYSRFLLATLRADFGCPVPPANLDAYRLPSGLYANLKQPDAHCSVGSVSQSHERHADFKSAGAYGVNATAAALFLLPETKRGVTADALLELQEPDGSFKAAACAPEGDLLSTATALFALWTCGRQPRVPVKPFLRDCFRETGLFAATPAAPDGDLEYTVYGLLAMGVVP